jgi:hypothetical protein
MNYIIKTFIKIYEYLTCVKSSKMSQTEIETYDLNMEYYMIYETKKNNI